MKYFFLFFILVPYSGSSFAQSKNEPISKTNILRTAEQMPEPGYDIGEYLSTNLHYPDSARNHNIEGRVLIQFVVDQKGKVTDCKVLKGIGYTCDEEALRVVSRMPPWKPGRQKGKPVAVYYTLPIRFKLVD